jgi:hypothetical protein
MAARGNHPPADQTFAQDAIIRETLDRDPEYVLILIAEGFGHWINNLVPCCKSCNSSKAGKNWKLWLSARAGDDAANGERLRRIEAVAEGVKRRREIETARLDVSTRCSELAHVVFEAGGHLHAYWTLEATCEPRNHVARCSR